MNDFDSTIKESCPQCGNPRMKSWQQLSDDEREIVKRLPTSATYEFEERKALFRWCTKCWFESGENRPFDA